MLDKLFQNAPQIIAEAAKSPLGIAALIVITLAILATVLFRKSQEKVKVGIFIFLAGGFGVMALAVLREAQPRDHSLPDQSVPALTTQQIDPDYLLMMVDLARKGCFFFEWDEFTLAKVPDIVESRYSTFIDGLASTTGHLEVSGYTETGYSAEYALAISARRALEVKEYLVTHFHVSPNRIVTIGMGLEGNQPRVKEFFCGGSVAEANGDN